MISGSLAGGLAGAQEPMLSDEVRAMLKYLRIAATTLCLMACVLLIALWVRSYRMNDDLRRGNGTTLINLQSYRGELGIGYWPFAKPIPWRWTIEVIEEIDEPEERLWPPMKDQPPLSYVGIRWQTMPPLNLFAVRYWFPVVLVAMIAILPWLSSLRWRFGLRTLLIVTTLIALAVGAIVVAT